MKTKFMPNDTVFAIMGNRIVKAIVAEVTIKADGSCVYYSSEKDFGMVFSSNDFPIFSTKEELVEHLIKISGV